jgi:hypothetical protein
MWAIAITWCLSSVLEYIHFYLLFWNYWVNLNQSLQCTFIILFSLFLVFVVNLKPETLKSLYCSLIYIWIYTFLSSLLKLLGEFEPKLVWNILCLSIFNAVPHDCNMTNMVSVIINRTVGQTQPSVTWVKTPRNKQTKSTWKLRTK